MGLKQTPQAWYFKLHKCLVSLEFSRSNDEQVVYLKRSNKSHLIIGVYVNDLLVMGENDSDISKFKDQMMNFFQISDLGQLCSYLSIELTQGGARITFKFMEHPTSEHLLGIKCILRYVRGTIDYGLVYEKGETKAKLVNYSDSNFASDVEDRKSTFGQAFFLSEMLIS
ncbi:unnamed protein product [Spirodela intermedia]|uniref:Reverse transcriptase Ty1/copia-type domain-containing protein n=1 Tax=Spirodela intermedia TaxID=51605 RepID=A0A7I8K6P5_SPIIN|nr:unnamed protein product [Spirodela intermedia]